MKRRLLDRIATLEKSNAFIPPAPRPEFPAAEVFRALLQVQGYQQGPNESLLECYARAVGLPFAEVKALLAKGGPLPFPERRHVADATPV